MRKIRGRLAGFVIVALSCGWVGIGLNRLAETQPGQEEPGLLLWLVAPLLSVIILRWRAGGWGRAGLRPHLASAGRWYLIAAALPLTLAAVNSAIATVLGGATLDLDWNRYAGLVMATLGFNLVKNVFEEFAWRGYLASELIERRFSDAAIYLIGGLVWGLWHLPYYVGLLDPAAMKAVLPVDGWVFAGLVVVVLTGWTVAMTELFRRSGSVWPCLLLHTVHNTFVDPLQVERFVQMNPATSVALSPILGLVTAAGYAAAGLWLRRIRLSRDAAPAQPVSVSR